MTSFYIKVVGVLFGTAVTLPSRALQLDHQRPARQPRAGHGPDRKNDALIARSKTQRRSPACRRHRRTAAFRRCHKNVQVLGHITSGEMTRLMTAMTLWVAPKGAASTATRRSATLPATSSPMPASPAGRSQQPAPGTSSTPAGRASHAADDDASTRSGRRTSKRPASPATPATAAIRCRRRSGTTSRKSSGRFCPGRQRRPERPVGGRRS